MGLKKKSSKKLKKSRGKKNCSLFVRAERGFSSRSSGIWSGGNRSVKKKRYPTIQPSNIQHPTIKDTLPSAVIPPIFVFFNFFDLFLPPLLYTVFLYFNPTFFPPFCVFPYFFYTPTFFSTFMMIFFQPHYFTFFFFKFVYFFFQTPLFFPQFLLFLTKNISEFAKKADIFLVHTFNIRY